MLEDVLARVTGWTAANQPVSPLTTRREIVKSPSSKIDFCVCPMSTRINSAMHLFGPFRKRPLAVSRVRETSLLLAGCRTPPRSRLADRTMILENVKPTLARSSGFAEWTIKHRDG
jgi:hypothetical protein